MTNSLCQTNDNVSKTNQFANAVWDKDFDGRADLVQPFARNKMTTAQRPILAIFVGRGTAALLGIVYAFVRNGIGGRDPLWVLQFVASGLLG
jgi:hypothetical protein